MRIFRGVELIGLTCSNRHSIEWDGYEVISDIRIHSLSDAILASENTDSVYQAVVFLQQECNICVGTYPMSQVGIILHACRTVRLLRCIK